MNWTAEKCRGSCDSSPYPMKDNYDENSTWDANIATNDSMRRVLDTFMNNLLAYKEPTVIALLCIYAVLVLVALFGNVMVLLVILTNRRMRNVTNYFLVNLAIADLLVTLFCAPLTVAQIVYKVWLFGEFTCKAAAYLQGVSISASVLTIMALSLERFLAIRYPVKARSLSTTSSVRTTIIVIWLLACVVMVPLVVIRRIAHYQLPDGRTLQFCHESWSSLTHRKVFDFFLFFFIYVIPGGMIALSYISTTQQLLATNQILERRESDRRGNGRMQATRRRVAKMLLVIAVLFAVSWMPYHILALYLDFNPHQQAESLGMVALSFALALGHSHSAQNPVIYCLMRANFNGAMRSMLACRRWPDTQPFAPRPVRFIDGTLSRAHPRAELLNLSKRSTLEAEKNVAGSCHTGAMWPLRQDMHTT